MRYDISANVREELDNILASTDFNKIQEVMAYLNWTWGGSEKPPTITELKQTARELLMTVGAINHDVTYMATGGFTAEYADEVLSLAFSVQMHQVTVNQEPSIVTTTRTT
jgi:hypothetical protein